MITFFEISKFRYGLSPGLNFYRTLEQGGNFYFVMFDFLKEKKFSSTKELVVAMKIAKQK